jgi:hypothetical protein
MVLKSAVIAVSLVFVSGIVSASAADAEAKVERSFLNASTPQSAGRIEIVNATQSAIIGANLGEAVAMPHIDAIAPGDSLIVPVSAKATPCLVHAVFDFDDGTQSIGDIDVCQTRKLTLHS